MKEQYVGDISDYRKYALLRALAAGGANRIGVCWMLTAPDGRTDGNKRAYLEQPERYRAFDPDLYDLLVHAAGEADHNRLLLIERSGIIPGASFFNAELTDKADQRASFIAGSLAALAHTDLIFFDPDNGLATSLPKGCKGSSKYLYLDEASAFYATGKSLLIYQHFPRIKREAFIASCASRLWSVAPDADIWAFRTAHVLFLAVLNPKASPDVLEAAATVSRVWPASFIQGARLFPYKVYLSDTTDNQRNTDHL